MATVVRMPAALAGATEGAIQTWLVGARRRRSPSGEPLAEIETEKAVVEYEAEAAGTVGRLLAEPGENVAVGAPIAVILAPGEGDGCRRRGGWRAAGRRIPGAGVVDRRAERADAPAGLPTGCRAPADAVVDGADVPRTRCSPAPSCGASRKERGSRPGGDPGTGPDGRIVRRDLEERAGGSAAGRCRGLPQPAERPRPPIEVPLTRMRRAIARRLTESKTTVPHFYVTAHCRVDRLLELRREVNEARDPQGVGQRLRAQGGRPARSSTCRRRTRSGAGDAIAAVRDASDIAVAVAVDGRPADPGGARRATARRLIEISAAVGDLAERARAGTLQQHELEGGSLRGLEPRDVRRRRVLGDPQSAAVRHPRRRAPPSRGRSSTRRRPRRRRP